MVWILDPKTYQIIYLSLAILVDEHRVFFTLLETDLTNHNLLDYGIHFRQCIHSRVVLEIETIDPTLITDRPSFLFGNGLLNYDSFFFGVVSCRDNVHVISFQTGQVSCSALRLV